MPKQQLRIEVVRSNLKAQSSMSMSSALAIIKTLSAHYSSVYLTNIDTDSDLEALIERSPDLVFLGVPYVTKAHQHQEKIWVSETLIKHGIKHTGSDTAAHKLGFNKQLAKQKMTESGLKTSPFLVYRRSNQHLIDEGPLKYPLFVKPLDKGGGQGIDEHSVVHNREQLRMKVTAIHTVQETDALIEQYLPGREFSIAVMASGEPHVITALPIELIAPRDARGNRMLSNNVKKNIPLTPTIVADSIENNQLKSFGVDAFRALGARDYARIDVRFDTDNVPHFLEVNLIPSLIDNYGSFSKAYALNLGLSHEVMLLKIVRLALERNTFQDARMELRLVS